LEHRSVCIDYYKLLAGTRLHPVLASAYLNCSFLLVSLH